MKSIVMRDHITLSPWSAESAAAAQAAEIERLESRLEALRAAAAGLSELGAKL